MARAAEPTKGTIDPILRRPLVTILIVVVLLVAPAAMLLVLPGWVLEPVQDLLASQMGFSLVVMVATFALLMTATAICILAERKISAYIQDRVGPNRVGWLGLFQPLADGIKFVLKEDIVPRNVDKPLFLLAPCMALVVALIGFIIIPWTGPIQWPWMESGAVVGQVLHDFDIGFLYLLAVGSLSVYGVVLAGYASNNKYSFYGGMRGTAQMLSYEVPIGLGLLCILMIHGDLRLETIVAAQQGDGWWNIMLQPLLFLILLISAFAESNRLPFDLPECEQELVGGFHTEYSAMKFAMFFLGEYAHMMTASALLVALFLGGFAPLPITGWLVSGDAHPWWVGLLHYGIFWAKIAVFMVLFMVVRWTIPRFRYDQLMRIAWQGLIPLGIVMVIVTGVLVYFGLERNLLASLLANAVVLAGVLWMMARSRQPVTGRQDDLPAIRVEPL